MASKQCFEQGCELEIQYICQCSCHETNLCFQHLKKHLKLSDRKHPFSSTFFEPSEETKDAIFTFLTKEKSRRQKLKKKFLDYFSLNLKNSTNSLEENLKKIDLDSSEMWIDSQTKKKSKFEDPVLKGMTLKPGLAIKSSKEMFPFEELDKTIDGKPINSDLEYFNNKIDTMQTQSQFSQYYANQSLAAQDWRIKQAILKKPNDPETEWNFRITCSLYESQCSTDQPPSQDYQEFINFYHQATSLYLICNDHSRTKLFIYSTEREREEVKILDTPIPLDCRTCITQLPNGELFCFGDYALSGVTLIIDRNYRIRVLPSGTPCFNSSGTYFNKNVYFFGGITDECEEGFARKFDLNKNMWFNLAIMPKVDTYCHSVIFHGNILISGFLNKKLLLYSIDIDSFSAIPYEFTKRKRKILINAERLYLIECGGGFIYESGAEDEYTWKPISKSTIKIVGYCQLYHLYNKGGIYISIISSNIRREYYKFDFNQKALIDIGYYNDPTTYRRLVSNYRRVEYYKKNIKFKVNNSANENYPLYYLGRVLKEIKLCDEWIKLKKPDVVLAYESKGRLLYRLGRYLESIECYNEAIKLDSENANAYFTKGIAFDALKRYIEAAECYSNVIKLQPKNADAYFHKGNDLKALERYFEAIECYDEAIGIYPSYLYLCYRGCVFNYLGRETKAVYDFNSACESIVISNDVEEEKNQIRLQLMKTLFKLQQNYVKFKELIQELKDDIPKNSEMIKKIEEKELIAKEQHSNIISRAVDYLYRKKNTLREAMQQIENEAIEHQKAKFDILAQLWSSCENKGAWD